MTSQREIAVVRPAEDWVSKDINLALRVHPFHTDSVTYSQRERSAYHNRSDSRLWPQDQAGRSFRAWHGRARFVWPLCRSRRRSG